MTTRSLHTLCILPFVQARFQMGSADTILQSGSDRRERTVPAKIKSPTCPTLQFLIAGKLENSKHVEYITPKPVMYSVYYCHHSLLSLLCCGLHPKSTPPSLSVGNSNNENRVRSAVRILALGYCVHPKRDVVQGLGKSRAYTSKVNSTSRKQYKVILDKWTRIQELTL